MTLPLFSGFLFLFSASYCGTLLTIEGLVSTQESILKRVVERNSPDIYYGSRITLLVYTFLSQPSSGVPNPDRSRVIPSDTVSRLFATDLSEAAYWRQLRAEHSAESPDPTATSPLMMATATGEPPLFLPTPDFVASTGEE